MTAPARILKWDSDFFGVRIGRVEGNLLDDDRVAELQHWATHHDIDCLYFLAEDEEGTIACAEQSGFHLVEVRITFDFDRERLPLGGLAAARIGSKDDLPPLVPVAASSYQDSRFFRDPNFDNARCAKLYEVWLRKSFDDYADAVLVIDLEDTPVGFVTCALRENGERGEIGLVGVDPSARGRGLGQAVVLDALRWFRGEGVERVEVVTQTRNVAAQRLYQACGFRTRRAQLLYHRWFEQ